MGRATRLAVPRWPGRAQVIADLLVFLATGAVVLAAGVALTRAADDLADRTGLGRFFMGSLLLAGATSLPELGVNLAATRQGAIDLATGNIFGSNMFNMVILAVLGFLPPRDEVFRRASLDHTLAAALAVILQAIAALLIATRASTSVGGVSPYAVLLAALFVVGSWVIYRQSSHGVQVPAAGAAPRAGAPRAWRAPALRFAAAAAVVLLVAPTFSDRAESIAVHSGLGATFFGTVFVGAATSLPEIVSCVAAWRLGAHDLAVGNLFGSNLFNVGIFLVMDLADGPGSVFASIPATHVVTALFGMLLTALGSASVGFRATRRLALVEPGSILILVAYVAGILALAQLRGTP